MIANLKAGKTIKALANLTTPQNPQTPFAPRGVSPQAERLLSLLSFFFKTLRGRVSHFPNCLTRLTYPKNSNN